MKRFLKSLFLIASLFSTQLVIAQDNQLLTSLPKTKEEYTASEPYVINTINWLETTHIDQEVDKRTSQKSVLLAWLTNSPEVNIDLNAKLTPFIKKNPELLIMFMGGWTRYVLQNSYSKDLVQGNLSGLKTAIKVYKMGVGLKKDKEMEKLIALDNQGDLERWVKDQLEKK